MSEVKTLEFEVTEKTALYQGFFSLKRYTIRHQLFAGGWSNLFHREIFERGNAAAVLLLDRVKETVVMVEQFRPGAMDTQENPWLLELVAGMIEAGEEPEQVVYRESIEEASCKIGRLMRICDYLVSPGGTSERVWLFLGEVDSSQLPELGGLEDENEDIRIHQLPVSAIFQLLDDGKVNNAMSLIAIQWLKIHWSNRFNFWSK